MANGDVLIGAVRAVVKVDSAGVLTVVAGTGIRTGSIDGEGNNPADDLGDGGSATESMPFVVEIPSGPIDLRDLFKNAFKVLL